MTRDAAIRRPHPLPRPLTLGLIPVTLMGGAAATSPCNKCSAAALTHPQIEMGRRYAHDLAAGQKPEDLLPADRIDLQSSLEPFAIFYTDNGALHRFQRFPQ